MRLRILSANLRNGAADADAFAELVRTLAPDAAALQEMSPAQADALARVLPHGRLDPALDYSGMGIALRQPASVRRVALPFRDAHAAIIPWVSPWGTASELELLNVHVIAPHTHQGRALRRRRLQLDRLLQHLRRARCQRVLVGDLNATPLWPVYRRLRVHLADAAVIAARRHGRRVRRTWGPAPRAPRLLRIDHALVHDVEVADFQVWPIPGSDHCAIVVELAAALATPTVAHEQSPSSTHAGG